MLLFNACACELGVSNAATGIKIIPPDNPFITHSPEKV